MIKEITTQKCKNSDGAFHLSSPPPQLRAVDGDRVVRLFQCELNCRAAAAKQRHRVAWATAASTRRPVPPRRVQCQRGDPRTGSASIPRSQAKRCCFKPHAVKVVYLFVTFDVTTHPCLRGAALPVMSTGAGQAQPGSTEMSPTTAQENRQAHLWLVTGGAGGESLFPRRGPEEGRCITKVMAIYLGLGEGGIFLVGLS